MTPEPFEIIALRYAHHGNRRPDENFIVSDPHESASDLDYFVWVVRRGDACYLVDTGFGPTAAERRGRTLLRSPIASLSMLGIDPTSLTGVILTHMHYDHAGNLSELPQARFHLQDREAAYATGRCMCHAHLRQPFEVEDAVEMVRAVYAERVQFHDGNMELAPGLTLHWVGGHSAGLQIVRVWTRRGWVVLASDAAHLYANFTQRRPFPVVVNLAEMLEGFALLERLADSPDHVVPGHDPLVMRRYPVSAPGLDGIAVRLDLAPVPHFPEISTA